MMFAHVVDFVMVVSLMGLEPLFVELFSFPSGVMFIQSLASQPSKRKAI
jgi:hypothetical protein